MNIYKDYDTKDFFLVNMDIELAIIKKAIEKNIIKIIVDDNFVLNQEYIKKFFSIQYKQKFLLKFSLITFSDGLKTIIFKKDKIILQIDDDNDIENFVDYCTDLCVKLYEDFDILDNNFYINKLSTSYYEEIFIKPTYGIKDIKNIKLYLSYQGKYSLFIDNIFLAEFDNVTEIINSNYLNKLKKNYINNFINFFKFF